MLLYINSVYLFFFFFFKQNPAYELRISDWSSDVCSSDLCVVFRDFSERPQGEPACAPRTPKPTSTARECPSRVAASPRSRGPVRWSPRCRRALWRGNRGRAATSRLRPMTAFAQPISSPPPRASTPPAWGGPRYASAEEGRGGKEGVS